jgi:hypothetical protein
VRRHDLVYMRERDGGLEMAQVGAQRVYDSANIQSLEVRIVYTSTSGTYTPKELVSRTPSFFFLFVTPFRELFKGSLTSREMLVSALERKPRASVVLNAGCVWICKGQPRPRPRDFKSSDTGP